MVATILDRRTGSSCAASRASTSVGPLYAALTTELTAAETTDLVVAFLRTQGPAAASISLLHRIAAEGEGIAVQWANQILELLESSQPGLSG